MHHWYTESTQCSPKNHLFFVYVLEFGPLCMKRKLIKGEHAKHKQSSIPKIHIPQPPTRRKENKLKNDTK